ncbi:hypothetical protein LTR91_010966 [Friedmanniomyces endolithicus]|uniref:Uncharacterized protein n=1 Tax=Friedmanniomyces endolithicus TaxID=329885 RepID=A0AAN6KJ31_9PEZI|nr:hypothetical protein LTR94_006659 [Friedmanniomyces endolithicus]KAK0801819.1 hypothetical protein LTR38_006671 [Friedmanniomyces endolithicus]KAK0856436.1 hypothetical protein LTS02_010635 [Friedmanniomyces endolithicus]KAK0876487.1 hypothetical protein LTR87_009687 [Friedmanniomyces endolithicus]KAK0954457.1 hypothetical protein LTS01_023908 [Friedmanniomyces endolithicus]
MPNPIEPGTVERAPPASSLTTTQWTTPDYTLPTPSLQFLFHLECDMESFRHIGQGPYGDRSTVIFKGGRFDGPRLRGEILPGGGAYSDWEIVRDHGDQQTAHLNTRYNLVTHDGATIYLQTTGTRTGAKAVLEKLGSDTSITADQYKMRLNLTMETGDQRYSWVNSGVFVASSGRVGDQVVYDAYELL